MEEKIKKIEGELFLIKNRNIRVEADKAWETSTFRVALIAVITYIVAGLVLYTIGNGYPLRNALIPALGYLLSTQSLPFIKKRWIEKYISRRTR